MTTGTKCCIHYKDGLPYCVECEKESDQRREELHAKLAGAEIERLKGAKKMTRTGYSCSYMRRKNKPNCPAAIWHYCTETCRFIDPMTCHVACEKFKTLAELHKRPGPRIEVELL